MAEDGELVRCSIEDVYRSTQGPVVFLVPEEQDEKVLPIFIDYSQAFNIRSALRGQVPPRPMTHDLMNQIVQEMGGRLNKVIVEELAQATFFASLYLDIEHNGSSRTAQLDARPSDCIALAVRARAPIFVRRQVLRDAGIDRADIEETPLEVEETDEDIDLGIEP